MKRFLLVLLVATGALAQQPYLVKDIRTTGPINGSSSPQKFVPFGAWVYFTASTREVGGLWRTDGTAAGTTLVDKASIYGIARLGNRLLYSTASGLRATDGVTTTTISNAYGSSDFTELNGRLFFASVFNGDSRVWVTDGTAEGTQVFWSSPTYGHPTVVGRFGDRVAFVAPDGFFLTDGTSGGTTLLTSKVPDSGPIVVAGDRFFFAGSTSSFNDAYQLWVSDGTAAGTHLVTVTSHAAFAGRNAPIAAIGNRVVFFPYDDTGSNLWISDGTAAGSMRVKPLVGWQAIASFNGVAYLAASDKSATTDTLWRTDGTASGTQLVGGPTAITDVEVAGGRLWITTGYPKTPTLWISDGTTAGTRLLAPMSAVGPFVPFQGRFVFAGDDFIHGLEPWWSDGTTDGTSIIADLAPNLAPSSDAQPVIATADRVLFYATDDTNKSSVWSSDGTAAGTQPTDITFYGSGPIRFRDLVYFNSAPGSLEESDGTTAGTYIVGPFYPGDSLTLIPLADILYIFSYQSGVWATDGPSSGVLHVASGFANSPSQWVEVAGHLVYIPYSDGFLDEIAGYDAPRPIVSLSASALGQAGGRIFYFGSAGSSKQGPFTTDGTADGVQLLATFNGYPSAKIFGAAGNRLLFTADDGTHGSELWSSDGTQAGTQLVKDIAPGSASTYISSTAMLDGRVVFIEYENVLGLRLWSTDGTPEGTMPIMDGVLTSFASLAAAKGLVFFSASDGIHGQELWQTDGTSAGTSLVADLYPGRASSNPSSMIATRDTLFFRATTLENGTELWALPIPWRTIAIADARASAGASSATMAVTLDAASSKTVSATWTSATGATGTIAFAPGETRRTISFPLTPDPTTHSNRMVSVRLSDIRGAVATKSLATLIVERVAAAADLQVSVRHSAFATWSVVARDVVITNLGPDSVPSVTVSNMYGASKTIAPGASGVLLIEKSGVVPITITGTIPDPNPANNTTTMQLVVNSANDLSLSVAPFALHAGMHTTLTIVTAKNDAVQLASSDPSVIAVPASSATPADLDVVALAPGTTTIAASTASGKKVSFDVSVVAADATYRWPPLMTFTIDPSERTFGTPRHLVARFAGNAWDTAGATPTGAVTFTEGSKVLAVAHVDPSAVAETIINSFLPGPHTITATYEGDAHFLGATATAPPITITGALVPTFLGMVRPLTDTTAEITITVIAPRAVLPTGTITLRRFDQVLAKDVPVIDGKAVAITSKEVFVTVDYSGDALYPPTVQSVNLVPARHRAAP